jgi:hypothetical protein
MFLLHVTQKNKQGPLLDVLEQIHIYDNAKLNSAHEHL